MTGRQTGQANRRPGATGLLDLPRPLDHQLQLLAAPPQVEQADQTLAARKLIYQGDRAFAKADLPAARTAYDQGLAAWP